MTLESIYSKKKELNNDDYFGESGITRYYTEIGKYPILTKEEERVLLKAAINGDTEAKKFLISCNLRYVYKMVNRYRNRGVDIEDLLEVGAMGLIEAVNNYDINNETRLLTYAGYYIKKELDRGIRHNKRGVSVGVQMDISISQYQMTVSNLQNKLMRAPTLEEIAKEMHISLHKLHFIIKAYHAQQVINMDSYNLNYEDDDTLSNILVDPTSNFEDEVISKAINKKLKTLIPEIKTVVNNDDQFQALIQHIVNEIPFYKINPNIPSRTTTARIGLALYKIRTNKEIIDKYIEFSDNPEEYQKRIQIFKELYRNCNNRSLPFLSKKLTKKL